jgi:hypothetical protein
VLSINIRKLVSAAKLAFSFDYSCFLSYDYFARQYVFAVFPVLLQKGRGVKSVRAFLFATVAMDAVFRFLHLFLHFFCQLQSCFIPSMLIDSLPLPGNGC